MCPAPSLGASILFLICLLGTTLVVWWLVFRIANHEVKRFWGDRDYAESEYKKIKQLGLG